MSKLEIASRILASLVLNPAIIQPNNRSGWGLVNCTEQDLADMALSLADKLIDGSKEQRKPLRARPIPGASYEQ